MFVTSLRCALSIAEDIASCRFCKTLLHDACCRPQVIHPRSDTSDSPDQTPQSSKEIEISSTGTPVSWNWLSLKWSSLFCNLYWKLIVGWFGRHCVTTSKRGYIHELDSGPTLTGTLQFEGACCCASYKSYTKAAASQHQAVQTRQDACPVSYDCNHVLWRGCKSLICFPSSHCIA